MERMRSVWKALVRYLARKPEILVIEITDRPLPIKEDEDSIRALSYHPGFVALTNRFKIQKAVLETKLRRTHHKDVREVDYLQFGIEWAEFYEKQVRLAVAKKEEIRAVAPRPTELEQFTKIIALIEGVK